MKMYHNKSGIKKVYIGKLNNGDDIIPALETFLKENNIKKGFINIIGAVQNATLGFYNQKKKKYNLKTFSHPMEIVSLNGNISLKEGKVFVHLHGIFSGKNYKCVGGHLGSPTLVFAGEFEIFRFKGINLNREYDELTGLYLYNNKTSHLLDNII